MREGWEMKKLGEVCEIVNGGTPDTKVTEFWNGKNLWITPKDMGQLNGIFVEDTERKITDAGLKNSSAKILPPNSVILSSRAPIGHLTINRKPISTNQGCKGLIPKENKLNTLFLFYFLKKSVQLLNDLGSGTTFKELSGSKLSEVVFPIPPLSEQHQIVSILDKTFAAIDEAKANTEKNLNNAKELFQSQLNKIFSEKGEGWVEKKLGEVCEVKDGTHDSPKYLSEGIPFVTQKNIRPEGLSLENTRFISLIDHDKFYKRSNVAFGDILISMIGANRGMSCLVNSKKTFSIKNVGLVKENEKINQRYLLYYLKTQKATNYVRSFSKGGAQEFIGLTELRKFPIDVAPLKEQQKIVSQLNALSAETKKLEALYQQKLEELEDLKKSILEKAFKGELNEKDKKRMLLC